MPYFDGFLWLLLLVCIRKGVLSWAVVVIAGFNMGVKMVPDGAQLTVPNSA